MRWAGEALVTGRLLPRRVIQAVAQLADLLVNDPPHSIDAAHSVFESSTFIASEGRGRTMKSKQASPVLCVFAIAFRR